MTERALFPDHLYARARSLVEACQAAKLVIATAESCTGGLVAALLTEVPGSSAVLDRGFVTYSNAAKMDLLGVPDDTLSRHGAVSEATARAMASGALARSSAHVSVSVTGIAGPGGGTGEKPVGLVHFGCARRGGTVVAASRRFGDIGRAEVRLAAVTEALLLLGEAVEAR